MQVYISYLIWLLIKTFTMLLASTPISNYKCFFNFLVESNNFSFDQNYKDDYKRLMAMAEPWPNRRWTKCYSFSLVWVGWRRKKNNTIYYSLCPAILVVLGFGETTKEGSWWPACPYIAIISIQARWIQAYTKQMKYATWACHQPHIFRLRPQRNHLHATFLIKKNELWRGKCWCIWILMAIAKPGPNRRVDQMLFL